jgi:hypothetical protein
MNFALKLDEERLAALLASNPQAAHNGKLLGLLMTCYGGARSCQQIYVFCCGCPRFIFPCWHICTQWLLYLAGEVMFNCLAALLHLFLLAHLHFSHLKVQNCF